MYVNWYYKVDEGYGFIGLKLRFADGVDEYPGSESINIEAWQVENKISSRELWRMKLPRTCISAKDLLEKLKTEYDGKLTGVKIYGLYTEITVTDKRYEALEWLESLALIHKMAGDA